MPTWSEILLEINRGLQVSGPQTFDLVRRKYLQALHQLTGRNTILYAAKWTQTLNLPAEVITIFEEDMQAFMEVMHGLPGDQLDLILHSPGGSPEVAEMLVEYLRSKFKNIRVIVPQGAMSAATMLACAADVVVMGKHSFLGPIDPQFILNTPLGQRMVPAQEIIDQFNFAVGEAKNAEKLGAMIPMLSQFGPELIVRSKLTLELTETLVRTWLEVFMFRGKPDAAKRADTLAKWLACHGDHKSHGRHLTRGALRDHGMEIEDLESNQQIQDAVLSVFHATTHVFAATPAVKIIENHLGRAFVKQHFANVQFIQQPAGS